MIFSQTFLKHGLIATSIFEFAQAHRYNRTIMQIGYH